MSDSIEKIAREMEEPIRTGEKVTIARLCAWANRLRALSPAGGDWVMVPMKMTDEMHKALGAAVIADLPAAKWWDAMLAAAPQPQPTPTGAGVYGLRQGNWPHPDGGRIVGWVVEPDDVERMKADAFCLPRELAECLVNLRNAHRTLTATSAGTTGDGWVSVDERLPDDGTECLVVTQYGTDPKTYTVIDTWRMQREAPVSFSSATIETGLAWDAHDYLDVLFWRPLPAKPDNAAIDAARRARGEGRHECRAT